MKYCLSILCLCVLVGCQQSGKLYHRDFDPSERPQVAMEMMKGLAFYYQGSQMEQILLREALRMSPEDASIHREVGVPYLKRGIPQKAYYHYAEAVKRKPEDWQGYRAYCWLYFYRDYRRALADAEACDAFTPDFVDYPQSTSVDYMKGICHYHLGEPEQAYLYLKKHLDKERKDFGDDYVDIVDYLGVAIAAMATQRYEEASEIIEIARQENPLNGELAYYQAKIYQETGQTKLARQEIEKARTYIEKGYSISRDYVEEFFKIYPNDVTEFIAQL